jgi:hypothetical protein
MTERTEVTTLFVVVDGIGDRFVEYGPDAAVGHLADVLGSFGSSTADGEQGEPEPLAEGRMRSIQVQRTGQLLAPGASIAGSDLRSGDIIRVVDISSRGAFANGDPGAATGTIHQLSGDAAGSIFGLALGPNAVGRVSSNDVVIVEPGVSRNHATVTVDQTSITVADLGSTNGVVIDGSRIAAPTRIPSGQRVLIGQIWVSIVHHAAVPPDSTPGIVEHNPGERSVHRYEHHTVNLPQPPEPAGGRKLLGARNRDRGLEVEAFEAAVGEIEQLLADGLTRERTSRLFEAPSIDEIVTGSATSWRLWERRALDPDGLEVRIGSGSLPSRVDVVVPPGGDPELRPRIEGIPQRYGIIDDAPAVVDLRRQGSVGLVGPPEAVDGLAHSLIAQLAWFHGPDQLGVACRSASRPQTWDWLKWLPHVDFAGSHNGVAGADFVAWVSGLLDGAPPAAAVAPTGGDGSGRPARPAAIVLIIDGAALPMALMARLLQDGPTRGIYTVVLTDAERAPQMPLGSIITIDPVPGPPSEGDDMAPLTAPVTAPLTATMLLDPRASEPGHRVKVETADPDTSARLARRLTPIRLGGGGGRSKLGVANRLTASDGLIVGTFEFGAAQPLANARGTATVTPAEPPRSPAKAATPRDLKNLPHGADDGRLLLGVIELDDLPKPAAFACNLNRDRNLALLGEPGTGRTSALRSVAAAAAMVKVEPARLPVVYYLDVPGDLEGIGVLPNAKGAVGSDISGFRAIVEELEQLLHDRTTALTDAGVDGFDEFRQIAPDSGLRRVVVLIDQLEQFIEMMDALEVGRALRLLSQLAASGDRLGVHLVFSAADGMVPAEVAAHVGRWLTLGAPDADGVPQPGVAPVGPNFVQFATVGGGRSPQRALVELGDQLAERGVSTTAG